VDHQNVRAIGKTMRTFLLLLPTIAICGLILGGTTVRAEQANPQPAASQATAEQSLRERSRLTGDWGGARTRMEAAGVKLDLELTMFYQGLASGTGDDDFEFGTRLDGFVKLDTGKMGLWQGGGLVSHLEYRTGDLPGSLGGTFFPTNSGMEFPSDSPDKLVATSLYLSQRFGERTSLLLGKINALDLAENDLFFVGWGNHRFMNSVFVAPPTGLLPPVFIGAVASYRLNAASVSLRIYDPMDRTDDYLPDDLFDNGVTFYLTPSWQTKLAGRPTTFSLTGIYTTKSGVDFSELSESYQNGLEPSTKEGSYSVGFHFSHLLSVNPENPKRGWGVHLKGAIADGNPNYVQSSIIAGIGGTGLFRGRELDSFGFGYFYYNLSDDLQAELTPVGERLSDEQGAEVYYSFAVTPWFFVTADLEYITPPRKSFEDAFLAGLRANIRF
jgi:porin